MSEFEKIFQAIPAIPTYTFSMFRASQHWTNEYSRTNFISGWPLGVTCSLHLRCMKRVYLAKLMACRKSEPLPSGHAQCTKNLAEQTFDVQRKCRHTGRGHIPVVANRKGIFSRMFVCSMSVCSMKKVGNIYYQIGWILLFMNVSRTRFHAVMINIPTLAWLLYQQYKGWTVVMVHLWLLPTLPCYIHYFYH